MKKDDKKNGLYAFKDHNDVLGVESHPTRVVSGEAAVKERVESASLFFHNAEEADEFTYGCDDLLKQVPDMLELLGVSKTTPIEDLNHVKLNHLNCLGCMYNLKVVQIPTLLVDDEYRLERFGIFAYIDNELVGIMSGYKANSDDIIGFYRELSATMEKTVCARSWRYLAERTFPDMKEAYDLAEKELNKQLQQDIIDRLQEFAQGVYVENHPCLLVSRILVMQEARECGILDHMMGALEQVYTSDYAGIFYLAPKRDSEYYDQYDIPLNVEIATAYGMEVVEEERPLAIMFRKDSSAVA